MMPSIGTICACATTRVAPPTNAAGGGSIAASPAPKRTRSRIVPARPPPSESHSHFRCALVMGFIALGQIEMVCATMRPSSISSTRSANCLRRGSWVTISTPRCALICSRSRAATPWPVSLSSAPVGSSPTIRDGLPASARARSRRAGVRRRRVRRVDARDACSSPPAPASLLPGSARWMTF